MADSFRFTSDTLTPALKVIDDSIDRALTATIEYHAPRAAAFAKKNAPWTDRSTNARNGLFSVAERDRPRYRIVVAHSMPYGIWLEVKNSGRYATINPTINHEGPEVMKTVAGLFSML